MTILSSLFSNSRNLVARNVLNFGKTVGGARNYRHVVCAPPQNKINSTEQVVYFLLLGISMCGIPAWIFYHIPEYQGEDRNTYTGQ